MQALLERIFLKIHEIRNIFKASLHYIKKPTDFVSEI